MKKKQGIILGIIIGIFVVALFVFWYFSPRWFENTDYPYYGHMIGGWGMPFGMLLMGTFWIGIIYFVIKGLGYRSEIKDDHAIETLKSRLAKGEITIEEYEKLLEKLRDK